MPFPFPTGSNYVDSIVLLILLPLIWIFIFIRIYVRGFITKQPSWDDATAVIAAVLYTLEGASAFATNIVSSSAVQPPSQKTSIVAFKLPHTQQVASLLSYHSG
ncbi:hypothetical protein EJ08DRAFT_659665 [Tothia fuscella]|uniref:Uncharacterized protein n=1 Tax=Tothia fuscella TaxID=1048955 RepID=A0A9P4NUG7_9PEZI|nr:hypothetical protein EJ08DRAFT_659665 [Tothia fuscella]